MSRSKYRYNTYTLTYDKITLSAKDKIRRLARYLGIFFGLAMIVNIVLYTTGKYPKLEQLKQENSQLVKEFHKLNSDIQKAKKNLVDIQIRDDNFFRPIFEIDPVSSSIRIAGFGGTYNYKNLEGFKASNLMIDVTQNVEEIAKQTYIQSKSYDQVIQKMIERENFHECRPSIKPLSDKSYIRISDYFGSRIDPFKKNIRPHYGIDFAGPRGGDIVATGKGIVTKAGYSLYGYGKIVEIDHGFGYKTRYAHLDKIIVKEGQKVNRGETIGLLGNTGRSTGPHLHYEVRMHNKAVNPIYFFNNDISVEEYDKMLVAYQKK